MTNTSTTLDKLRQRINANIELLQGQLAFIDSIAHPDITTVIRAIGGKWKKIPNAQNDGKIDYTQEHGDFQIRMWAGQAPPNCKMEGTRKPSPRNRNAKSNA